MFHPINDVASFDGINGRVVNQYGTLDQDLLNEALKMSGRVRPGATISQAVSMAANTLENHTSVLFNLLRMKIMKEVDMDDLVFKMKDTFYDDGHVSQNYEDYLRDSFDEKPSVVFPEYFTITGTIEDNPIKEGQYCVHTMGMSAKEVRILAMALAGWKCNYPIRLFSGCERLCDMLVLNQDCAMVAYEPVEFTALEVDAVLRKLIALNRLAAQFDLAYSMVVLSMFTPCPRAIEANAWVSPIHKFGMPRASSMRGMIPELVGGTPFYPRPSSMATWENYKVNPYRIYLHGVAMCEAMYTGLYEVITNSGRDGEPGWMKLGIHGAGNITPFRMAMECASLRFGKQMDIRWETHAGPDIMTELLTATQMVQNDIAVAVVGDVSGYEMVSRDLGDRVIQLVRSRFARPVMFPVLSMGINDDRYYNNKLDYVATMQYDAVNDSFVTVNANDANKMLMALRVSGNDAKVIDTYDGVVYKNWAANSNGQVMPDIRKTNITSNYVMPRTSVNKRLKNWATIPPARTELRVRVRTEILRYVLFKKGKPTLSVGRIYYPAVEMPTPYLDTLVPTATVKTKGEFSSYYYQDFLMVENFRVEQPIQRSMPVATTESLLIGQLRENVEEVSQEGLDEV